MDKKPRKLVYRQAGNQLQTIGNLFIATLLHHRPPGQDIYQFMEQMFCVDTRFIFQCVATSNITVDGKTLRAGQRVFVRHDITRPNLFELELVKDSGFVLNVDREEWAAVRESLRVTDKNRDGVEKVFGARG